ncbi:hypothetical protein WJX74_007928 [Apatococcus lobatus]|uniref:Uncharacterized protein n=1 Tax=Apatococcus lobatus TaxID=904363 RepID=A0AAW1S2W3_9CHLO
MQWVKQGWNRVFGAAEGAAESATSLDSEGPTGGFATKLAVHTERPAPVLQNPGYGSDGGTQGLEWYKSRLKQDQDGDIADQFLEEVSAAATQAAAGPSLCLQEKGQSQLVQAPANAIAVHHGNVLIMHQKR